MKLKHPAPNYNGCFVFPCPLPSILRINTMALLNFPIPELDTTLQEVSRVLQLLLSPELFSEFESSVEHQREALREAQQRFAAVAAGRENWVTEIFKRNLLSCDDPLPTSTALPFVLLPSRAERRSQLGRAAALLWAAARLHAEPCLLEGSASLESTQQSELFAATRVPGRGRDEIKVRWAAQYVLAGGVPAKKTLLFSDLRRASGFECTIYLSQSAMVCQDWLC